MLPGRGLSALVLTPHITVTWELAKASPVHLWGGSEHPRFLKLLKMISVQPSWRTTALASDTSLFVVESIRW